MQRATSSPVQIIAAMLSGFPSSSATDPDMAIRAYILAIEDIAYEAIARAAKLFLRGEVQGHNKAFAPSCAEFAEQCRHQALCMEAERKAGMRVKIEAPKDEVTPVAPWKLKLLNEALQGSNEARAKLREMFPHISISEMADTPVSKLEGDTP